ncbi:MAG: prefoldin subunit alpha [Candidatus Diapherotrites archaeon]|nr:prefoldin subunit alpha [Candidatus Diapherotrites archaeon]
MVELSPEEAAARLQYDEARIADIERQINTIIATLNELRLTKNTLSSLPSEERECLIPVGVGVYLPAKLGKESKVPINVGSDVVVEKNISEVLSLLEEREKQLVATIENLQQTAKKIGTEASKIRQKLEEYLRSREKEGNVPVIG